MAAFVLFFTSNAQAGTYHCKVITGFNRKHDLATVFPGRGYKKAMLDFETETGDLSFYYAPDALPNISRMKIVRQGEEHEDIVALGTRYLNVPDPAILKIDLFKRDGLYPFSYIDHEGVVLGKCSFEDASNEK